MTSNNPITMPTPTLLSTPSVPLTPQHRVPSSEGAAAPGGGGGGSTHGHAPPGAGGEPAPIPKNGGDDPNMTAQTYGASRDGHGQGPGSAAGGGGDGRGQYEPLPRPPVFREPTSVWNRVAGNAFFFVTVVLGILLWIMAIVTQALSTSKYGNGSIATLWLSLFLLLFLLLLLLYALATSSVPSHLRLLHSLSLATFVLGALGVDRNIFSDLPEQRAVAAAWVIICVLTGVWMVVFASERGGGVWHVVEGMGYVGLGERGSMMSQKQDGVGAAAAGRAVTSGYDVGNSVVVERGGKGRVESFAMREVPRGRSVKSEAYSAGNPGVAGVDGQTVVEGGDDAVGRIKSGSGYGWTDDKMRESKAVSSALTPSMVGGGRASTAASSAMEPPLPVTNERVLALFPYTASSSDPTEVSFQKGEVMQIIERTGKWWTVRKENGTIGIIPSNYVQLMA
ncbi:hypothetical protein AX16_008151 [Volvariella volvacea WC 439]|nr:hypothetical protein AX16_008151 [Volvariella volvacea WC 439]